MPLRSFAIELQKNRRGGGEGEERKGGRERGGGKEGGREGGRIESYT